jgi:uncharacterized protein (TIGR02453 family)
MVRKSAPAASSFRGFTPRTLEFLHKLSQNNDRDWFQAHKAHYERDVLEPALDFIQALARPLARVSPRLLCVPKRMGGSLLRIYRDTRFAHDKRPYKTNVGMHFRHDAFRDIHGPGCYFHIGLDECFLGCGIWQPDPDTATKIRQHILDSPRSWQAAKRVVAGTSPFEFHGAVMKRAPRGFPPDHRAIEDLKRKDFLVVRNFDEGQLYAPDIVDFAAEHFAQASPLMRFLCTSLGAKF